MWAGTPIRAIFTVSEETGLEGALFRSLLIKSRTMINLDSEEEGVLYWLWNRQKQS